MTDSDLAERLAGIAALADPIRRDLYLYVSAQPAPVSRDRPPTRSALRGTPPSSISTSWPRRDCSTPASSGSPNVEARAPAGPPSCTGDPAGSCQ